MMDEQAENCMRNFRRFEDPLNQYLYMIDLLDRLQTTSLSSSN